MPTRVDPTPAPPARPRALVILAHPDDPEFGAGGTVARWSDEGIEVHYIIVTDGSKGSGDPTMTPSRLAVIRVEEQRAAAAVLGVGEVVFLGFRDGEIAPTSRCATPSRARSAAGNPISW